MPKPTRHYDFIMAGGGAAGLSLAYRLGQGSLRGASMLIIDRQVKNRNDHTWCSWLREPDPFDAVAYRTWNRLTFHSDAEELQLELAPYRYRMLRSYDFYRFTREALTARPGVDFLLGDVERIVDGAPQAEVWVNDLVFSGDWVFDSRYGAPQDCPNDPRYHHLLQHFLGWEIETPTDAFDPDTPRLFDFGTPQRGAMRFCYVLPYTTNRAMVEYTLFSANSLPLAEYEDALRAYIRDVLHIHEYRILDEERAAIPMTDAPFPRRTGRRVMAIGTRGGRVKGSTGYAFQRIQKDSAAIIHSLQTHGHPFAIPTSPRRYQTFDTILLHILDQRGRLGKPIFTALFKNNPVRRLFRFLDEEGSLWENIRLMASVPSWPFIQAWSEIILGKKEKQ